MKCPRQVPAESIAFDYATPGYAAGPAAGIRYWYLNPYKV
jgi:hypothetical protein